MIRPLIAVLGALTLLVQPAGAQTRAPDRSQWPSQLTIATASAGGTYAVYGEGIARVIRDAVKIPIATEATQGPSQNLVLIQNRAIDMSMTTLGPAWEAWNGQLDINPGVQHRDVRALFPMYEGAFQMVALRTNGKGIASAHNLEGKTVGIGPASATGAKYYPAWFSELGIHVTTRSGQYMNLAGDLAAGRLDAMTFASGLPNPTILDLETAQTVNIFSFNESERQKILGTNPFLSPFTVPAGTYRSMKEPQETVAMWNFAIANKAMPDELAYEIVRAVLQSNQQLTKIHESAVETKAENVLRDRFLWLHPGAIRYYRSVGLTVPDELLPPELQRH